LFQITLDNMVYHKRYMYDKSRHGADFVDPNGVVTATTESHAQPSSENPTALVTPTFKAADVTAELAPAPEKNSGDASTLPESTATSKIIPDRVLSGGGDTRSGEISGVRDQLPFGFLTPVTSPESFEGPDYPAMPDKGEIFRLHLKQIVET
jgi:hypothetical protein